MKNKNNDFVSLDLLRKLFTEMREFEITKLVLKEDDKSYEIHREASQEVVNLPRPTNEGKQNKQPEPNTETSENYFNVKTPVVGTFYRSASPDTEPFIDIGDKVSKGDPLCIVEAMKAMNEIESEVDGIVKEILVENGNPVEYDQTLFLIEE